MDLNKPNVSEEMAKDLAKKLYGLEVVSLKRLVSYDDQNFHIKVSQNYQNPHINSILDTGYTLKIANTKKTSDPEYFGAMHSIMFHQVSNGIRSPVPLRNVNGNTWSLEIVPLRIEGKNITGPNQCGVHVLSYIEGVPLSTVECTNDILFKWGQFLAKYHEAVKDFVYSNLKAKKVFWSLEYIPKLKDYLVALPEDKKELINSVLKRYPIEVEQYLNQLPRGAIHGDFNENNVLVRKITDSRKTTYFVDGVLDFEDIHLGTYAWDVGVMMAYALITYTSENVLDAPGHALAGYLSVRPLNTLELSKLKMFVECRLCQSLVLGAYSYQQDPGNEYLIESAKTGWTKLEQITRVRNEELQQRWKDIELSYT